MKSYQCITTVVLTTLLSCCLISYDNFSASQDDPSGKGDIRIMALTFHHDNRMYDIDTQMPCHQAVSEKIINLLETSDDTFDMAVSPAQMNDWRAQKTWVELILDQEIEIRAGYVNQTVRLRRILVFFRNNNPLYIFFGTAGYSGDKDLAANTGADTTLFELLQGCVPQTR